MQTLRVLAATIVLATASGALGTAGADAGAVSGASITGAWMRTDGGSRISVDPCGERFCAVNTWIKDPSKGEAVGDRLVMTLQPRDPVRLAGEAFDEKRGLKYSMLISVGEDAMTTQGCVLSGIVCKTMNWTRPR
jgi:uncharacterized protein (DUF2147 family)